jgi:ATP-dependent Clp protease ATP-binding subunit ClpX
MFSCSFCGKPRDKVAHLITGAMVYICNECIDECNQIIAERNKAKDNDA